MTQQNMISPGELERTISDLMLELGIPAHLRGYQFLRSAIGMCVEDMELVGSVTKLLYPDLAKMYQTTDTKIERAIRNAIEVSWERETLISLRSCSVTVIHWNIPDRRTVNISPL